MKIIKKPTAFIIALAMVVSMFCAVPASFASYKENGSDIKAFTNGNFASNTFDKGIFVAESSGSGLFAIALYKDSELVSLSVAQSEEELESVKLNMIVDDMDGTEIKVFRFDSDGTPICVNKTLKPQEKNYRIFFNETFDIPSERLGFNSNCVLTSDGQVKITGSGTRYGGMGIYYPDRYLIIEADYTVPEGVECAPCRLICTYTNSPVQMVYISDEGLYAGRTNPVHLIDDEVLENMGKFNVACKLDLENFTYDVYVNREKMNASPISLSQLVDPNTKYSGFTTYAAYIRPGTNDPDRYMRGIILDNYRAYSGNEFIDIGYEVATEHRTSFKNAPSWESSIYERPEGYEIAKKALETGHPRVLINSEDVERIKNAKDERTAAWRDAALTRADALLKTEPFVYALSSTDSIQNIPESISLMMDLGLAYLLTGDKKYSDRAYREVQVLYTVPYKKWNGTLIPEESRDYWNSYSYLDVGEISFIVGLCYDWMYDAWTDEQKAELTLNVMEKGLLRGFNTVYGNLNPTNKGSNGWYKSTNNWNAICNGGSFMSAIAFMEQDPYLCANVAEATLRGFEYLLHQYAPAGAWSEGAGYWRYALQYVTSVCSTLDAACGTDYGISKTPGLKGTQLYSISLEGKTSVMNFGDGGSGRVNAPFLFYWANKYKDTDIGGAALYIKEVFGYEPSCFDLIYYKPDYITENWIPPLSFYYEGTEVVSLASGYDPDDTYIAISGGKGVATSHDHLDSGAVVLEMKGKRLFNDIGAEHYGAAGYFSDNRYLYFRARPEGHSTFVIDPTCLSDANGNIYYGQRRDAVSEIINYDPQNKTATMDLSEAYDRDAQTATRTLKLEGNTAIISDSITLKDTKDIFWNWYIKTKDDKKVVGSITISEDGKSAKVLLDQTEYNISFEVNSNYTLYVEEADYYVNVDPDVGGRKHKNTDLQRLVLKIQDASGTINVKTIVE